MQTFTWTPDWRAREESKPRIEETPHGDGYQQRATIGLNTDPKTVPLTFANRSNAEREEILGFLETNKGKAFIWTDLRGISRKWICREWDTDFINFNVNTITATFIQVFEF